MTKITKRILAAVMSVVLLVTPMITMAEETAPEGVKIIKSVRDYIKDYYRFDINDEMMLDKVIESIITENPEMFEPMMDAIMDSLDEHSVYYNKEESEAFNAYIQSEIVGIGAQLTRREGYITIVEVLEDSPAQKAGLRAEDRFLEIDNENAIGIEVDMAVSRLRGEKGTEVEVVVERNSEKLSFTIVRDTVKQRTVTGTVIEDTTIGYIKIASFSTNTSVEFLQEYGRLIADGADRFIIDLRDNTGGLTAEAYSIISNFIPEGASIVEMRSKVATQNMTYINRNSGGKIQKLVLLVNENSASASEIMAAAIKDNNAGVLVGTKTYGKGTAQGMVSLGKYGTIKMTISEFFGPNGESINKVGVAPHHSVKNLVRPVKEDDFTAFSYTNKHKVGDNNEEVLGAKYRLRVLGYFNGTLDEYFDEEMMEAIMKFQQDNKLYPYGVLDFTTQITLNNLAMAGEVMEDIQLDNAIELVKEME